ncbi:FecR domain-containing protein [uncultured Parabacteroides sp.]|mgnify:CR=1 FL=1|nr:FecR domain-containing protein [uncultured Parabacteroides sp.]
MKSEKNIHILEDFLQGKASGQEIRYLLSQLDNAGQWDGWMKDKWEKADSEIDTRVERKMYEDILRGTSRKRSYFTTLRRFWNVAASIVILFLFSFTVYLLKDKNENASFKDMTITVDKGQKASVTLPDGTLVWMNSASSLHYGKNFNASKRNVRLEGEAYFEVAKNPEAPFTVMVGDVSVTALGTSFNLKGYPGEPLVSALLIEGSIEVSSPYEHLYVLPNEVVHYDYRNKYLQKTRLEDIRTVTAWRDNRFVLDDQSLLEITNLLSRQYNVTFRFTDESLKDYQYTGTLGNTSLQSILQILSLTSPLSYQIQDSVIVLSENKQVIKQYNTVIK